MNAFPARKTCWRDIEYKVNLFYLFWRFATRVILPEGVTKSILDGYVPMVSQSSYPIRICFVVNYAPCFYNNNKNKHALIAPREFQPHLSTFKHPHVHSVKMSTHWLISCSSNLFKSSQLSCPCSHDSLTYKAFLRLVEESKLVWSPTRKQKQARCKNGA